MLKDFFVKELLCKEIARVVVSVLLAKPLVMKVAVIVQSILRKFFEDKVHVENFLQDFAL